ncbi:MAG: glutamate racemase [Elusimicrobia bacterium GWA2_61_42]|nr:MAG: glutamate racemase [Elusimicrobia bacterium GWA2_61_42]OGR78689.1 MAG: glutamate racemase [Elusimicrobia bacterium GWC2_61_25]
MKDSERPIGIFDSGLGGLTVFKSLRALLPGENLVYFGDTARVPYGTKSAQAVIAFSKEITAFLLERRIKLLVVACNTASSLALDEIRKLSPVPVLGVILPGVEAALKAVPAGGRVLVTGTSATVNSRAYSKALAAAGARVKVLEKACPLFVPLVEEGWCSKPVAAIVAREYLAPFRGRKVDALILGCTHYPLLKKVIAAVMGPRTRIVDSARVTAACAKADLERRGLLNRGRKGSSEFIVSDAPERFSGLALRLLGIKTGKVAVKRF